MQHIPEGPRYDWNFTFVSEADKQGFIDLFIKVTSLDCDPITDYPLKPFINKRLDPVRFTVWQPGESGSDENQERMTEFLMKMVWMQQQLDLDPQVADPTESQSNWNSGVLVFTTVEELENSAAYFEDQGDQNLIKNSAQEIRQGRLPLEDYTNTLLTCYSDGPQKGVITESLSLVPFAGPSWKIEGNMVLQFLTSLGLDGFYTGDSVGYSTFLDRRQMRPRATETDLNLLKTLYHPALKPGMAEQEVRAVLDGILTLAH